MSSIDLAFVIATFLLAGGVKGVVGLGLPTVGMAVLSLQMRPVQAAALLILPSLVTNLWQAFAGGALSRLLRRLWPMLIGICLGSWAGAGLMTRSSPRLTEALLGAALLAYAISGLSAFKLRNTGPEQLVAPAIGATTGLLSAATGVFVLPATPYLQGLGLGKDELVQALGVSFTVSTLALAGTLAGSGSFDAALALPSLAAVVAALLGMALGQRVRARLSPDRFRRLFFLSLLALGADLVVKAAL